MDERRERAFAASIEDVDFFIDRFRKRASGPRGARFRPPLDRLLRLKERLVDLRISTSAKASRGRSTDVLTPFEGAAQDQGSELGERLKSIEEGLLRIQEGARAERGLEQRFAKLNLTMSAILDSLSERSGDPVDREGLRAVIAEALQEQGARGSADPERLEKAVARLESLSPGEGSRNGAAIDQAGIREAILAGLKQEFDQHGDALKEQGAALDEHGLSLGKLAKRLEDVSWLAAKGTENAAKLDRVSENLAQLRETIEGLRQEMSSAPGLIKSPEGALIDSLDTAATGLQSMLTNILGALANVPRPRTRTPGGRRSATQPVPPGFEVEPRNRPLVPKPPSPETMRTQKMSPEAAGKAHRSQSGERRVVKMPPPPPGIGTGRPFGVQAPNTRASRNRSPVNPPKAARDTGRKTIIPAVIEGAKNRPRPPVKKPPERRRNSEHFRFKLDDLESSS